MAKRDGHDWLHYIYPEHSCYNLRSIGSGDTRIAMSCHLPADKMESGAGRPEFKRALQLASALITMSPDDVPYYQGMAPDAKVGFIPHGIDIHHFQPPVAGANRPRASDKIRLLTVGSMMRDFDLLAKTINYAAERKLNIEFGVVANQLYLDYVRALLTSSGASLFSPYCGISNQELISLYHTSHLLFLPLLDATANNAILEAMACGLPMFLTDLPATRIYAGDAADFFSGGEPDLIVDGIVTLAGDPDHLRDTSERARNRAISELSWEAVIKRQYEFLMSP